MPAISLARGVAARANRGFTLLELLVAVAIFAVVASLAWGGLDAIVRVRRTFDVQAAQLARLQRAMARFERDLGAALPRSIRDERNRRQPALAGSAERLEVSAWLPAPGMPAAAPTPQRLAWTCADGQLRRTRWAAPDRTAATAREDAVVLEQVSDCRLRYLMGDGTTTARWPLPEMPADALPRGVELDFRLQGQGRFRRVIELAQAAGTAP
ncbi:type II secretion system minor pseudopilin GspJ [Cognatiluteimonas weifangensis]|uniref:Type II secretion system protein J n=1 Tax=Cognatiluteimonas weifangensis TaxID=2303539 RepID=A0A372DKJ0_9GAMM|nr:type II secretion system minor pseudopilin GspJ [Luteimonas weifangensis]RFP60098.1 type II secretion system protein GspJ [Luteimonas weifangensis]